MNDVTDFLQYWRVRIEKDLAPFADPGTRLEIDAQKRMLTARWMSRGVWLDAVFSVSLESGVQVSFKGQSMSYKSFFASPDLADLFRLAKTMLQTSQAAGIFVPTLARPADEPDAEKGSALGLLQDLLRSDLPDVTRIVMVTGEAGAGKTRVLQQLVREQAQRYQRGQTDALYLYINAQGRALARFNEALATELQDLRASLTYHAVSALVRLGVLVPIIDGFDELLGVGGYDDAFSSLTGFIEELDGYGQIVASARSTYYEQEFVARASSVSSLGSQAWTQVPIEVLPWEDTEFDEYVRLYAEGAQLPAMDVEALKERIRLVFSGPNAGLRRKPLFVARTVDVVRRDPAFQGGEDLLKELVRSYLERERLEKLLDRNGGALLTVSQLELLFKTVAEEMWNQETRELDRRSVREIAEFVLLSEGLSEAVQRVVVERMPQLAFLVPGERTGGIAFEHEMFFSFFLAHVFRDNLLKDATAMRMLLGRSVLPLEVAATAATSIHHSSPLSDPTVCQPLLDRLAEAGAAETPRTSQVRENAGLIVAAILKAGATDGSCEGLRLWRVVIPGGDLEGVHLRDCRLEQIELRRVDLTKTQFEACQAKDVLLTEIIVNKQSTRLELAGVDVTSQIIGLRVRDHGLIRGVYDPVELRKVLIACGTLSNEEAHSPSTVRSVAEPLKELLEKLARAYARTNPLCTADDTRRNLFMDSLWPRLERLLLSHAIVTRETRATSGPAKPFIRRQYLPEEIMAGADKAAVVPVAIRAFWDDLEKQTLH